MLPQALFEKPCGDEKHLHKHTWQLNLALHISVNYAAALFLPVLLDVKSRLFITTVSPTPGTTIRKYKYNPGTKRWRQVATLFVWHDKNLKWYLGRLGE